MALNLQRRERGSSAGYGEEEELDPEEAEERAYLEALNRKIQQMEHSNPEKAQLEKILRLSQRFRVNANKAPADQMEKMRQDISNMILEFVGMVRKK